MVSSSGKIEIGRLMAAALVAAAILSGGPLWGDASRAVAASPEPVWSEVPWPFPIDQWGKGRAFACKAADCGEQVALYIRAKIGFCNCATGVADDEELDRISDFDLIGGRASTQAPGHPIAVGWMKGRSRPFTAEGATGAKVSALSVGFNDRCDAIIATAVMAPARTAEIEPAVLAFLNSATVLRWAEATLGR
jgi:hypothetical protein